MRTRAHSALGGRGSDLVESHVLSTGAVSTAGHWKALAKVRSIPESERCTHTRRTDVRRVTCSQCLGAVARIVRRTVAESDGPDA